MEHLLLCGDDDQCIYRFSGASPEAFLDPPVPDNMKTVLNQSYRVPKKVLDRAMELIVKVKHREPKTFRPRQETPIGPDATGNLFEEPDITWKHPEEMLPAIRSKLKKDMSVMILASCSYMLKPIEQILRQNGMPFANPYRRTRGDWNPLHGGGNGISASELLTAFFNHGIDQNYWNVPQFLRWASYIKVGSFGLQKKIGNKALKALAIAVEDNEPGLHTIRDALNIVLSPNAVEQSLNRNIDWLLENVKKPRQEGLKYPVRVYKKYGISGVEEEPKIILGTIHSVKGGEADCVFLFPDFSQKADREFQVSQDARDSMYRFFYVGMTRAKHELVLCGKSVTAYDATEKMFVEL
jgi:DNA helicase-2/ATP-dependent DNA helicase PcrA